MQPIYRARAEERNKFRFPTLKSSLACAVEYTYRAMERIRFPEPPFCARAMGTVSCTVLGTRYPLSLSLCTMI